MHPGRRDDAADAVADDHDVLHGDAMGLRHMPHEGVGVVDQRGEIRRVAASPGRQPMTSGIPGEHRHVGKIELVDHVLPAAGMLVPAMKQDNGPIASPRRLPGPIEHLGTVKAVEDSFLGNTHHCSPSVTSGTIAEQRSINIA